MNDKGEMICPLCAEEMDLTDQHLKPCKCGYQICVWCWHHIIEMAEKDKTEGRCPACRTPYDKEKIVEMTVSCDRLVAELNNDRKKSQKVKPKPSEGRKELTGVRVIQRNLVYVLSLPLELADEDLLQQREYFGQYGKVVKVALSRTAAGAVQQFPNNTCSVYITYSKEKEAIRCIQSVHAFILDGRTLKACFGTMKYCHAWLRNTPCTNADCLYLHEIGSQEDSFTKDETISVHMRKIVQQITDTVDNYPRRTGSMLPPPVDDFVDDEINTRKVPTSVNTAAHKVIKSSLPNGSNVRSVTLPAGALWGMNASSRSSMASAVVTNTAQISAPHSDVLKKSALEDDHNAYGNALKPQELLDDQTNFPELSVYNRTQISNSRSLVAPSVDNSRDVSVPLNCTDFPEDTSQFCKSVLSNGNKKISGRIQSVSSNAVMSVDAANVVDGNHGVTRSDSSQCDHASIKPSHIEVSWETREVEPLQNCGTTNANAIVVSREVSASTSLMSSSVTDGYIEGEDDISLFNRQRLDDPEFPSRQPSNIAPISQRYMSFREPSSLNHSMLFPQGNGRSEIDDRAFANILSLDLDDCLTSPHRLASSGEVTNNQSRFSFARQETPNDQAFESYNAFNQIGSGNAFYQNSSSQRQNPNMDMLGMYSGSGSSSSYRPPSVSRFPVSAPPPGFSAASRPLPPPGFALQGREQQAFNGFSGDHRYSDSTMFSNQYQSLPIENTSGVRDVQFMDPAILAVGQGFENASLDFRSNLQGNTNFYGNELNHQRQQLVMQNGPLSSQSQQNYRFNDSMGRTIDQSQGSNIVSRNLALPTSQWDGLSNEIQNRNRLQNDRLDGSANWMNGYNGMFRS